MLQKSIEKNDKKAHILIWIFSVIVFAAVTILDQITVSVNLGFDPHVFAMMSALTNSIVAVLLVAGLYLIKQKKYLAHKNTMMFTMVLSILFLVFYIAHHLFTGETKYGDLNHDSLLSDEEKSLAGMARYIYYFIISTHVLLAGIVMPFVLYSAYRALTSEFEKHKKLVRYTFPIWLYVAITGVIVYLMISPFYI
jgi:putative membrane protein